MPCAAAVGFERDRARGTLDRLVEQCRAYRFKEKTVALWSPARSADANGRRQSGSES